MQSRSMCPQTLTPPSGGQGERRPREGGEGAEANPEDLVNRGRDGRGGGRSEGRGDGRGRGGRGGRREGDGRPRRREYDRHDATGRGYGMMDVFFSAVVVNIRVYSFNTNVCDG